MIHKNIYSNRIKNGEEIDPYNYDIRDEYTFNSLMMFFNKYTSEYFLYQAVKDFCETKRKYISNYTKEYILDGYVYTSKVLRLDMEILLREFHISDVLDFLDICIGVINMQICRDSEDIARNPSEYNIAYQELEIHESLKIRFLDGLNEVFEHNNLGYRVINEVIATKESDYLHEEVIKKPLTLLVNEEFSGPIKEFENAIEKYTDGDYENTVIESCKAFESTMKAVLDGLTVQYDHDRATADVLISLLIDNGIFNSFQGYNLNKLTGVLMGLPTIRNRQAGHGDGINTNEVDRSYASFALNLAGSYIVFILDRYYEKQNQSTI